MKQRLDKVIAARGLTGSRERAKALIMEGKVLVNDLPVLKAGAMVDEASVIRLREKDIPFVSRGGLKLQAAIKQFGIDLAGMIAMDVGASTGGFTDCMLGEGVRRVYCIDVGYGQFDWALRQDPRVVLMERTNIRHLTSEAVPDPIEFAAIDVSFISLRLVVPKVVEFLAPGGGIVALIKPQFEVGRKDVGKGGIVRDEVKRQEAVASLREFFSTLGLKDLGVIESPIKGQKGNIEYLVHMKGE